MIKINKQVFKIKGNILDLGDEFRRLLQILVESKLYTYEDMKIIIDELKENK